MRFLLSAAAVLCLTATAFAQPRYTVCNNCPPGYVVVNRVAAKAPCVCGDACKCAAGDCPAKCPTAKSVAGTIKTDSGRLIRPTAGGYAYADDEPDMVLDCSSGRCKWVAQPSPSPSFSAPPSAYYSSPSSNWSSGYSFGGSYSGVRAAGGCAGGQCASPRR